MLVLVTGLVLILWGEPCWCGAFDLVGDIRHYAVAPNTVYVATEDRLYQLDHDLRLIQSVSQRGVLEEAERVEHQLFHRVSGTGGVNATFRVNVLLPYVENNTLLTCGVTDNECGYCEVLELTNISNVLHREPFQVGPTWNSSASVAFLVKVQKTGGKETYVLSAVEQDNKRPSGNCTSGEHAVALHNTNNQQAGSIFSSRGELFSPLMNTVKKTNVEFVDGFQVNRTIYLFSNVPSGDKSSRVRLIWMEGEGGKAATLKSVRGATLRVPEDAQDSKLLASSVVLGGPPLVWSGVFSVGGGQADTQLVLFDISPDTSGRKDVDPDFCVTCETTVDREVSMRVTVGGGAKGTFAHQLRLQCGAVIPKCTSELTDCD